MIQLFLVNSSSYWFICQWLKLRPGLLLKLRVALLHFCILPMDSQIDWGAVHSMEGVEIPYPSGKREHLCRLKNKIK